jgi:hypothetical protein
MGNFTFFLNTVLNETACIHTTVWQHLNEIKGHTALNIQTKKGK